MKQVLFFSLAFIMATLGNAQTPTFTPGLYLPPDTIACFVLMQDTAPNSAQAPRVWADTSQQIEIIPVIRWGRQIQSRMREHSWIIMDQIEIRWPSEGGGYVWEFVPIGQVWSTKPRPKEVGEW